MANPPDTLTQAIHTITQLRELITEARGVLKDIRAERTRVREELVELRDDHGALESLYRTMMEAFESIPERISQETTHVLAQAIDEKKQVIEKVLDGAVQSVKNDMDAGMVEIQKLILTIHADLVRAGETAAASQLRAPTIRRNP